MPIPDYQTLMLPLLIDGETLAGLMVDHNVAVTRTGSYELKKIDVDYFEGE